MSLENGLPTGPTPKEINDAKIFAQAHFQMMQAGGNIDREKELVNGLISDLEKNKISPAKFKETIMHLFESRDEI